MPLPERHRDLIEETRAANRQASAKPKPVPNRIGDRDPVTGQHSAIYPDGSESANGRKLYDAHSVKGDTVTGLPVGDGTVGLLGPKGQLSPLAAPEKEGVRGIATQGPLKTNAVGYLKGQVWSEEEPEPEVQLGTVLWLDCNWLFFSPPQFDQSIQFLLSLFKAFKPKQKRIYTLSPDDPRLYDEPAFGGLYSLDNPSVLPSLTAEGYSLIHTAIADAQGLFFLPLFRAEGEPALLTVEEFAALRRLAKRYGLLVCGEWDIWADHDDRLLRGLQIRDEVVVAGSSNANLYQSRSLGKGFLKTTFTGAAQGYFGGLKSSEKLVTNQANNVVFAYFK